MKKEKHLIIGSGPAALAAAQAIRSRRPKDIIKIVTREDCLPYSPASLPYLFSGEIKESGFFAKGADILKTIGAAVERGREVEELRPEKREVGYRDGGRERFDKVLIATGSRASVPPVAGLENVPYHKVRVFGDYQNIKENLGTKRAVAIYGGGLVAVEMAEKLTRAGHSVTILARSSLLRRYLSLRITRMLKDAFTTHGVAVRTDCLLQEVRRDQGKIVLSLKDGDTLAADLLLIAVGVEPNCIGSSCLPVSGGGLKTDDTMETPFPGIYAAGDVAAAPGFFGTGNEMNPILPEALEQGRVAGTNMAGEKERYRGSMSWNFLSSFDQQIFNVGRTGPGLDEPVQRLEREEGPGYLQMVFRNGSLIGVECANMKGLNPGMFGYLITRRLPVNGLERLLLDRPSETANWLILSHRRGESPVSAGRREGK
jgi:phenylglyoxylate dehydrogenase epsilon subunit